jgi:hypothetical protein
MAVAMFPKARENAGGMNDTSRTPLAKTCLTNHDEELASGTFSAATVSALPQLERPS